MTPPPSKERVLSTLEVDGRRHWLRPKLSRGRFLRRRRIVGYALIALFVALPLIEIGGRPALQLDLISRELSLFGSVWRPSDGVLLMLLGLAIAIAVFLVTALFGRVWCGWACPQSVYLEHVFRPIERWLEGSPGQQRQLDARKLPSWRRVLKWAIFAALSFALANVFLAYFVGVERLREWVVDSPMEHPGGFGVVAGVAALMLFDFAYFREQTCSLACPYGRLQSVLLDKQSLIIGYDAVRGEPRGKPKKSLPVVGQPPGDCVDCRACVTTCPTGIDIRDGLQMECIGCAQCIDACDDVMDRLGRARGLVGYTSQQRLAGAQTRWLRARTIVYPAALALVAGALAWGVAGHDPANVWVERVSGEPFVVLESGRIAAQARLVIENASDEARQYTVVLRDAPDASLWTPQPRWRAEPRRSITVPLIVELPRTGFTGGARRVAVQIEDDAGFRHSIDITLLGPSGGQP